MKPLVWYRYLRAVHHYSPRNAMVSTLMNFCCTSDDIHWRANRIARILNANDRAKGLIK